MKLFPCIRQASLKLACVFASMAVFGLSGNARAADAGAAYTPSSIGQRDAASRPRNVPADYVVTPDGFFAPSCVQRVHNGETVLADGSIQAPGFQVRRPAACTRPHYRFDGDRVEPSGAFSPAPIHAAPDGVVSRWLEAAYASYSGSSGSQPIGRLSAYWKVPGKPVNQSGQSLFFFTEVEQSDVPYTLLRPVLSYNAFDDAGWTLSTWVLVNGTAYYSDPISVDEGDLVLGVIQCQKANSCDTWTVKAMDVHKGQSTFQNAASGGKVSLIFGGSLEVANVSSCDQLPASSPVAFWSIFLDDASFSHAINPTWRPAYGWSALPCNFDVSTKSNPPGSVFLSY